MAEIITPERILRELAELWVSLGKQPDGETSNGVLRACAMTMVVVAEAKEDAGEVGETLAALMREHPSRAIVVRVDSSPATLFGARVFAQCWMPFGRGRQICCEQIEISTPEQELGEVPVVILPLVAPDLPVIVWCRIPRLLATRELGAFSRIATKTIVDSASFPDPVAAFGRISTVLASGYLIADLTWARLTCWRQSIAQVFENRVSSEKLHSIRRVKIVYTGGAIPAAALYLAAWLRLCLETQAIRPELVFESTADGAAGNVSRVELEAADPSGIHMSLAGTEGLAAELRVDALVSRTVFSRPTDYVSLREELSITGRDVIYEKSLALAVDLAARGRG